MPPHIDSLSNTHTHMHTCTHARTHARTHTHTHTHTDGPHLDIHTHTHTHTDGPHLDIHTNASASASFTVASWERCLTPTNTHHLPAHSNTHRQQLSHATVPHPAYHKHTDISHATNLHSLKFSNVVCYSIINFLIYLLASTCTLWVKKNFTPRFSKTFPEGLGFLKLIFYQSVHLTGSLCIIMLNFMEISHTAAEIPRLSAFFKWNVI